MSSKLLREMEENEYFVGLNQLVQEKGLSNITELVLSYGMGSPILACCKREV